jgi:UDP-N-acetylglucosamine--N-acetylmuramyl-(pentapeptide) pyrophosphoryl-undecaprenol N-acetylglucosamine transferase
VKMLIAGGGTGGHLYPGVALAEEVLTRQKGNEVLFVGTQRGLEFKVLPELGLPLETIEVSGLKGTGLSARISGLLKLPLALFSSIRILRRFKPDVAVGVGGYASGPVILAAWLLRIPTAVLEQNTVPGVTNRLLAKVADAVYVMFDESAAYFPRKKVQALGNPIRRQLLENFLRSKGNAAAGRFQLLVLGGSQGAHNLNVRMLEATDHLAEVKDRLVIVHQTGVQDELLVKKGYEERGFTAEVLPFIKDVSEAYRRAELIVCRAGATTLAEVMVVKKASILVPFPHAADNHQEKNAQSMVDAGAALMLVEREMDGLRLAETILTLINDPSRIEKMEQAASRVGRPEAASEIVAACVQLIERRRK